MKILENYIKRMGPELMRFAYIISPDDVICEQLVISSVSRLLKDNAFLKQILINIKSGESLGIIKRYLLKNMYKLKSKRYYNVKATGMIENIYKPFFQLNIEDRCVLYLKDRANYNYKEIEEITGMFSHDIIAVIFRARNKFNKLLGGKYLGEAREDNPSIS